MDNPQEVCQRCAGQGKTCCSGTAIFVTQGDATRIQAATGSDDFWQMQSLDIHDGVTFPSQDAVWERIFSGAEGTRILRHDDSGNCCFLATDGCRLAMDVRPLVCRLYPYEYTSTTLKGVHGHLCPWPERENGILLLALLGMSRDEAEAWRKTLYEEIAAEFPE